MATINANAAIQIMRRSMGLVDERLQQHCDRTAYVFLKLLQAQNQYVEADRQIFFLYGLLHDFAALKTDDINDILQFDQSAVWPHSIYGYLYMQGLSPFPEYAKLLLYHHLTQDKLALMQCSFTPVVHLLQIADRVELLLRGGSYSPENAVKEFAQLFPIDGIRLFVQLEQQESISEKLLNGTYLQELDAYIAQISWDQTVADSLLQFLVYTVDFKHETTVARTLSAVALSQQIATRMRIDEEQRRSLYYASLVYDLGMLHIPDRILHMPRALNENERAIVRQHVKATDDLLRPFVCDEIRLIAIRHHERVDGLGYPQGLRENQLTLPEKILAVADVLAALQTDKEYKHALSPAEINRAMSMEIRDRKLNAQIVRTVLMEYDAIMDRVQAQSSDLHGRYLDIKDNYETVLQTFSKL